MSKIVIFLIISLFSLVSSNLLDDLKNVAKTAGPNIKDLLNNKEKVGDIVNGLTSKLSDLVNGANTSELNTALVEAQFMTMMMKALQNSVSQAKDNKENSNFLNAEGLSLIFQMIQHYKQLFKNNNSGNGETTSSSTAENSNLQAELAKGLMGMIAKGVEGGNAGNNNDNTNDNAFADSFMKNLLGQILTGGVIGGGSSSNAKEENNKDAFTMKDLNKLMQNMKEINDSIDKDKLREMTDFFKGMLTSTDETAGSNEEEPEKFDTRPPGGHPEGPNIGLIVVITILSTILVIAILALVRRYYKQKRYLTSRMVEHKPLSSVECSQN